MSLHQNIKESIKDAMRAKDQTKLMVLRALSAAFTNEVVALKRKPDDEVTDEEALVVIMREAKKRKDAIEQFTAGGRPELAANEQAELAIIETYLPAQMSREEIEAAVIAKKEAMGITDASQKGQFIGAVMKDLKGKADGKIVQEIVESLLK
ncbi:MAG: GatB/YqeY domain-containing protein [Patescibacteria group bacterium]